MTKLGLVYSTLLLFWAQVSLKAFSKLYILMSWFSQNWIKFRLQVNVKFLKRTSEVHMMVKISSVLS